MPAKKPFQRKMQRRNRRFEREWQELNLESSGDYARFNGVPRI